MSQRRRVLPPLIAFGVLVALVTVGIAARSTKRGVRQHVTAAESDWSRVDSPPLSPRQDPAIAWTGEDLVVFGGNALRGDRRTVPLNDGALYDPARGDWVKLAGPTLTAPLFAPSALWLGSELLVVGSPCDDLTSDPANEEFPQCAPGGVSAVVLDPARGKWRTVPAPDFRPAVGSFVTTRAVGVAPGRAFFQLDQSYWTFDIARETWTRLPEPPQRTQAVCLVGDELVAVTFTDRSSAGEIVHAAPGQMVRRTPPAAGGPAGVGVSAFNGTEWSPAVRPAHDLAVPAVMGDLCAGPTLLVYPAAPRGSEPILRFDAGARTWRTAATPPSVLTLTQRVVWTGSDILAWTDAGPIKYVPATDSWSAVRVPEARVNPDQVVWVGDRAVLYFADRQNSRIALETYEP